MYKFTVIGFTGTGKSTTMAACMSALKKRGYSTKLINTDALGEELFTTHLGRLERILKNADIELDDSILQSSDPLRAIIDKHGAQYFRALEFTFIKELLEESGNRNDTWFDLGGKASSSQSVHQILQKNQIIPVFLYLEHDTAIDRLIANDEWQKRASLRHHGELGWKDYAAARRKNELPNYINFSKIIINIDKNGILLSPDEVVREIFYRLRELELNCRQRSNAYTQSIVFSSFKHSDQVVREDGIASEAEIIPAAKL